ncbi:MAG: type 3 dihydrofolate reductase [Gammaproteobacteria bacterium]|nr:type 3 dihydrofolate reductase [Gammaproteobacteria bacterium]
MILSIIVAIGKNNVIGYKNQLPWHLPADLSHFKKLTLNKTVVMGRKTYESIGKPLSGRENIIITHDPNYQARGCKIATSLEQAIKMASSKEVFIIGGQSLYAQTLPIADRLYLTLVDIECPGDTFFPAIHFKDWEEVSREPHFADSHNPYDYCFVTLKRRKSCRRKAVN